MFMAVNDLTDPCTSPAESVPERDSVPGTNRAFQSVLEHVPGSWFFARKNGRFAYANRGASDSLGYAHSELSNATIFDIDPSISPELWQALWAETPPPESRTIRTRHRRKDGSVFPVEIRASRVLIDGEDLAVSYSIDLTANENTERINRRLLAAIEQTSEAVVVTDALGRVEYVNPAYERSTGLRESAVRGQAWSLLEAREDARLSVALLHVLSGAGPWQGRIRSQCGDDEARDEDVSLSPLRDASGVLVGCVAVKRDVTKQLRLEQQLAQGQRIEAVGQLAGGIAHDFNNLLQVICAQAQLIRIRGAGPECDPMLNEISNAVERAANLVRQLLAFSRKGTVEFSNVRLDQLVASTQQMLKPLFGPHIDLLWNNDAGAVYVRGNAPQLEQVVVNLCINARDAMPGGGVLRLALDQASPAALPSTTPAAAEFVVLGVWDSGVGMTSETQSRLFEPFFTTKPPGKGTGLGLATVKSVVEAHAGWIEVDSEPHGGSRFQVFLPCTPGMSSHHGPESSARVIDGAGRWVVVAEDEPAAAEASIAYLERAGFRVLMARDGVEADELLRDPAYDVRLAVLDAVMPKRGGQAVLEGLLSRGQKIPIVFVTGYDYESLAGVVHRSGITMLQKPFSGEELLAAIAEVLEPASPHPDGAASDPRPTSVAIAVLAADGHQLSELLE
jgi:PAS domain S-box-containing protein